LTDNYIRVEAASAEDLTNRITPVRLAKVTVDGMMGELTGCGLLRSVAR
jgi:hypothetical protein